MAKTLTPHQKAEATLTRLGLSFPETEVGLWIAPMRDLKVRGKSFCIFGAKDEPPDSLSLVFKLPISAEMAQDLYFVQEARGWMKQHNWVRAFFGPHDDIAAELETLKGWLLQSFTAVAPKRLSKQVLTR